MVFRGKNLLNILFVKYRDAFVLARKKIISSKLGEVLRYFCCWIPYLKNYTKHAFTKAPNYRKRLALRKNLWLTTSSRPAAPLHAGLTFRRPSEKNHILCFFS